MPENRWERVKRIVDEALHVQDLEQRRRYLDRACDGEDELRSEVDALLRQESGSLLDRPVAEDLVELGVDSVDSTGLRTTSAPSGSGRSKVRFAPGTVLNGRYRVIERTGRGGMGEVYHAEDLSLEQDVALKFLPPETAGNRYAQDRFRREVRTARQISHPNVCRVYDLGEVDGLLFISMEFIRGEDLQTLIRRIGRIPPDRATEVAVQLVSGLAAAHARGVLHRDLKPANVMLDDQGHARITDFGLAAIAGEIESKDIRSGTPAYMAPEQKRGESVTEQSDLYSLGLVLYELFTGEHPFAETPNREKDSHPVPPSSLVSGIDAKVESVISQCLEHDPAKRPASAEIARVQLPGGNRLEAAVARGETPARALVAEAGVATGFSPAVAWTCLAVVMLGLAAGVWLGEKSRLSGLVPLPKSPELLMADARRALDELGYETAPRDVTYGFARDRSYIDHLLATEELTPNWWQRITRGDPGVVRFWYREAPAYLVPRRHTEFFPSEIDPPVATPGMVHLRLDTLGQLRAFHAIPRGEPDGPDTTDENAPPREAREPAWETLFTLAGFDASRFTSTAPRRLGSNVAWEGVYPSAPEIPIRVEAQAVGGRVTRFQIIEPWTDREAVSDEAMLRRSDVVPADWARVAHVSADVLLLFALSWLAWRNLRLGRGDRELAIRLALILSVLVCLQWLLAAHHIPERSQLEILEGGLYRACYVFVLTVLLYLALEPYARKLWPNALVSWVRLLSGRFRDPVVGRDVLAGCVLGVLWLVIARFFALLPIWRGQMPRRPDFPQHPGELLVLRGLREALAELLTIQVNIVTHVMFLFVALLFFRLIFRKTWIAVFVHWLLYVLVYGSAYGFIGIAFVITSWHVLFFRFGWLAVLTASLVADLLVGFPLTADLSAWYAYGTVIVVTVCMGLALYGFKVSLAGRPAFRDLLDAA